MARKLDKVLRLGRQVLRGIVVEFRFATGVAKIVRLTLVFALCGGLSRIDLHSADGIGLSGTHHP